MKKIFLLVGPSGSGKTSLGKYLTEIGIPELISHTTREIREGEIDGLTYYYVNKDEFNKIEKIEYSEYSGNYYCLSKKEIEDKLNKFKHVFVIVDINGVRQIKEKYPEETISIFIEVTLEEMIQRMEERKDSISDIANRVYHAVMSKELLNGTKCDYTIRNKDFEEAKEALNKIVKLELVYNN